MSCECQADWLTAININGVVLLNYGNLEALPTNRLCQKHQVLAKTFYVKRNRLKTLPNDLSIQYPAITELYLTSNQIRSLPENIGELKNLSNLDMCDNRLVSFPDSLTSLSRLKQLRARHNYLKTLPVDIGNIRGLEVIDVSYNEIQCLPSSIGNCENLRLLLLSTNTLASLPREISHLSKLEQLSITSNQVSHLPIDLGSEKSLSIIEMDNNSLLNFCPSYFTRKYCHFDGCAQIDIEPVYDFHEVILKDNTDQSFRLSLPTFIKACPTFLIVPSLKELTSRAVSLFIRQKKLSVCETDLPKPLYHRLKSPLGTCYFCPQPMFWWCTATIDTSNPVQTTRHFSPPKRLFFLSYFCTKKCAACYLTLLTQAL